MTIVVQQITLQDPYKKGRQVDRLIPTIEYHGFRLDGAYKGEYRNLADADCPAWPDDVPVAEKLAIVFCVSLCLEMFMG